MMWVSVVRIESDTDPGLELVTVLRERFGQQVRTTTQEAWLFDEARKPPVPVQVVRPLRDTHQRKLA